MILFFFLLFFRSRLGLVSSLVLSVVLTGLGSLPHQWSLSFGLHISIRNGAFWVMQTATTTSKAQRQNHHNHHHQHNIGHDSPFLYSTENDRLTKTWKKHVDDGLFISTLRFMVFSKSFTSIKLAQSIDHQQQRRKVNNRKSDDPLGCQFGHMGHSNHQPLIDSLSSFTRITIIYHSFVEETVSVLTHQPPLQTISSPSL